MRLKYFEVSITASYLAWITIFDAAFEVYNSSRDPHSFTPTRTINTIVLQLQFSWQPWVDEWHSMWCENAWLACLSARFVLLSNWRKATFTYHHESCFEEKNETIDRPKYKSENIQISFLEFIPFNFFYKSLDFIIIQLFQSFGNDSILIVFQLLGLNLNHDRRLWWDKEYRSNFNTSIFSAPNLHRSYPW